MKKINWKAIFKPSSVKADVKKSHILQLVLGLVIIIFLNVIGYFFLCKNRPYSRETLHSFGVF